MANYLVTGAAGFIASKVCELLLADGHFVFGIDNVNDAYDVRIKNWRLDQLGSYKNFVFSKQDICDYKNLEETIKKNEKFDAVINLAARAGVRASVEDPWTYIDTNINGTLNLLEIAQRYQIPKFILASTSSVYGADAPLPTPEEADSSHPLQAYAASKKGAEALCHSYHFLYDIDVTVFRYFTVYGPAGRPDMSMFRFTQWINEGKPVRLFGTGEQTRGFTYVDDIARGTILGLKPVGFEIMNLGGHETISINQMISVLEDKLNKKANIEKSPAHPADMMANWADVSKAKRVLGWQPEVDLNSGMQNLVDWYLAERDWTSDIRTL